MKRSLLSHGEFCHMPHRRKSWRSAWYVSCGNKRSNPNPWQSRLWLKRWNDPWSNLPKCQGGQSMRNLHVIVHSIIGIGTFRGCSFTHEQKFGSTRTLVMNLYLSVVKRTNCPANMKSCSFHWIFSYPLWKGQIVLLIWNPAYPTESLFIRCEKDESSC